MRRLRNGGRGAMLRQRQEDPLVRDSDNVEINRIEEQKQSLQQQAARKDWKYSEEVFKSVICCTWWTEWDHDIQQMAVDKWFDLHPELERDPLQFWELLTCARGQPWANMARHQDIPNEPEKPSAGNFDTSIAFLYGFKYPLIGYVLEVWWNSGINQDQFWPHQRDTLYRAEDPNVIRSWINQQQSSYRCGKEGQTPKQETLGDMLETSLEKGVKASGNIAEGIGTGVKNAGDAGAYIAGAGTLAAIGAGAFVLLNVLKK